MRCKNMLLIVLLALTSPVMADSATAIFAGGCFWCMESDYDAQTGVTGVVSGFTGGTLKNPTYSGNHKGHFEAVEVTYDPAVVSYATLLEVFWRNIDPFDNQGQFCDKGPSYRSAIFPGSQLERELAERSKIDVAMRFDGEAVYTEILNRSTFWPVEEYHQDYYLKNPVRYKYYRWNCGRDQRLEQIWGSTENTKNKGS
ncbi:MAG: peptide-methionine (S)-S-oxide reductase MsrA [Halioglobus sp.]|jgi:peptide-methionine (S)-S-oxide reductase|nr:peptide-methionine (S)-S-oxide reductase MsrA [Halioglobus sp.]